MLWKTYPAAQTQPQLSIIILSFSVFAFNVADPEGDAWEFLGHGLHVGLVCFGEDVYSLECGYHFFAPPGLEVPQIVQCSQGLAKVDERQARMEDTVDKVDDECWR